MKLSELEGVTEGDYDSSFGINVKGVVFLTQVCFCLLVWKQDTERIRTRGGRLTDV